MAGQDGNRRIHAGDGAGQALGYRRSLDGLRAVAVLAVVVYHGWRPVLRNGAIGVDVFFVLSGFLITTLLLEEVGATQRLRLGAFYLRRAARLFPGLALLLLTCALWAALSSSPDTAGTARGVALAAGYSTDVALALHPAMLLGPLGPTWSLSVEEQFYALWPLALLALTLRAGARRVLVAALAGAGCALALRLVLTHAGAAAGRMYFAPDTRADALLIGCALAAARHAGLMRRVTPAATRLVAAASWTYLAVAALAPTVVPRDIPSGFSLVALAAAGGIWGLVSPAQVGDRLLSTRAAVHLGRISYGVYLWHLAMQAMVVDALHVPFGPLSLGVMLLTSLLAAEVSYRFLESPCRRAARRLLARREAAMAAAVTPAIQAV